MKTLTLLIALSTAAWGQATLTGYIERCGDDIPMNEYGAMEMTICSRIVPPLQPTDTSNLPTLTVRFTRSIDGTMYLRGKGLVCEGDALKEIDCYGGVADNRWPAPDSLYVLQDADSCPFTNGCPCDLDCPVGSVRNLSFRGTGTTYPIEFGLYKDSKHRVATCAGSYPFESCALASGYTLADVVNVWIATNDRQQKSEDTSYPPLTRAEIQAMIDAAIRGHDAKGSDVCVNGSVRIDTSTLAQERCIDGNWYPYSMNGRTLKPFPRSSSATEGRP